MFPGFRQERVPAGEVTINVRYGGSGPPALLLHGYPQSHVMWHLVAPQLARSHTVVAADLRGYGDSDKPPGGEGHIGYSKRTMAADMVAVMRVLGHERFAVIGHDRGGRVGHRMALDHPERVERLAVLDIVPTYHVFANVTKELATLYYHWFFLIQPFDLPERLIGAERLRYLHAKIGGWGAGGVQVFAPEALAEYERCFTPEMIHASCEDYRAAASVDLTHDAQDRGRLVACPTLALWGVRGVPHRLHDVLEAWRGYAADVRGQALACGHYLAEERPDETAAALLAFLAEPSA